VNLETTVLLALDEDVLAPSVVFPSWLVVVPELIVPAAVRVLVAASVIAAGRVAKPPTESVLVTLSVMLGTSLAPNGRDPNGEAPNPPPEVNVIDPDAEREETALSVTAPASGSATVDREVLEVSVTVLKPAPVAMPEAINDEEATSATAAASASLAPPIVITGREKRLAKLNDAPKLRPFALRVSGQTITTFAVGMGTGGTAPSVAWITSATFPFQATAPIGGGGVNGT
jgi:hypothetical protein